MNKEQGVQNLHPSQYTNTQSQDNFQTKQSRTLLSLSDERNTPFSSLNLGNLKSPGSYNNTGKEIVKQTGSNTNSMFKNLYGETLLTFLFFSQENIKNLQNLIKMLVFEQMNKVIDNQSKNDLTIVMRSIFLEYSDHPPLVDQGMEPQIKQDILKLYTTEVNRLNQLVLNWAVPNICSQLQQYLMYLEDSISPIQPIPTPVSTGITGTRSYRSITNVLSGGNL